MPEKATQNNELLKTMSADLSSISKDVILLKKKVNGIQYELIKLNQYCMPLKEKVNGIQYELIKLNMIENKIQRGEIKSKDNGGWFELWWH